LNVMQHLIDQWQLELDWARSLREQELSQAEGMGVVQPTALPDNEAT